MHDTLPLLVTPASHTSRAHRKLGFTSVCTLHVQVKVRVEEQVKVEEQMGMKEQARWRSRWKSRCR